MSEVDNTETAKIENNSILDELKQIADTLNITYHVNIGVDKLRAKIEAKKDLLTLAKDAAALVTPVKKEEVVKLVVVETKMQKYTRLRKEATKLVRVRVNCMNPQKQKWPGEVLTVRNSVIGTIKKFIPYNLESPYHIPNVLYEHLRDRQCQIFVEIQDKNRQKRKKSKLIKEFSIDVLPNLTEAELKDLAIQQAMSNSIE